MRRRLAVAGLRVLSGGRALVMRVTPLRLRAVKALVRRADGRVLLVRHSYGSGLWMLPGGLMRRREDPADAVRREIAEELGVGFEGTWELVAEYRQRIGMTRQTVRLLTLTVDDTAFRPNPEIAAAAFVDPADPPAGTSPATLRRLGELAGGTLGEGEW